MLVVIMDTDLPLPQGYCLLLRSPHRYSLRAPHTHPGWRPSAWSSSILKKAGQGLHPYMAYGETKNKMVPLSLLPYCIKGGWDLLCQDVFTAGDMEVTQMLLLALGHSLMGEK